MADSVSTSSGVEEVDVEEIGSDDEEGSSDEQEYIEEEPTQNYNLEESEGTEDGTELQPLRLEEEEGNEGEDREEQEEDVGVEIDLQGLSEMSRVDVDVLKSLLTVDHRFPHVLANIDRVLNEYAVTLQQFSDNLTTADQTLRELVAY